MSIEPVKVVADILQTGMGLADGQVLLAYQKDMIPTDGLLIIVTAVNDAEVARDSFIEAANTGGEQEVTELLILHEIQIDLLSFSSDARTRRMEVMAALSSAYSQRMQVANTLQIARNTTPMMDTSFLEVTKFLSRYTTRVRVTALHRIVNGVAEYYDDFSGELNTDPVDNGPTSVDPKALTA